MDISVITVTWNSAGHIARQLDSVRRALRGLSYEHIVVDNGSSDSTAAIISQQFSEVTLLQNTKNVGFAAANNQALKGAQGNYFLFLNPDMEVSGASVLEMKKFLDANAQTAIVGCRLENEQGENRLVLRPSLFPSFSQLMAIIFKLPVFYPKLLGRWCYMLPPDSEPARVDTVRGSCFLMRRALFEQLGFAFDPRYFIWFEDVDICKEARRLGWEVYYLSHVSCVDYMGQSFKQVNHVRRQKQFLKSAVIYFKKWHKPYQAFVLQILSPLSILVVWLYGLLSAEKIFKFRNAIER